MYLEDASPDGGEMATRLSLEGAALAAGWLRCARKHGGFDWNLLCSDVGGEDGPEVAERWRFIHWLNEMKQLDVPYLEDLETNDRETCAAIIAMHAFDSLRKVASFAEMTPQEVFDEAV